MTQNSQIKNKLQGNVFLNDKPASEKQKKYLQVLIEDAKKNVASVGNDKYVAECIRALDNILANLDKLTMSKASKLINSMKAFNKIFRLTKITDTTVVYLNLRQALIDAMK